MSEKAPGARKYDAVTHGLLGPAGRTAGVGIGIAVDVFIIVGTGGGKKLGQEALKQSARKFIGEWLSAIADMADLAVLFSWALGGAGDWLDSTFGLQVPCGAIVDGSRSVFYEKRRAAHVQHRVGCFGSPLAMVLGMEMNIPANLIALAGLTITTEEDKILAMFAAGGGHMGSKIADGSISVEVEGYRAARIGSGTTCDAKVATGATTVLIGGMLVAEPGTESRSDVGAGMQFALNWFPVISFAFGLLGSVFKGWPLINASDKAEGVSTWSKIAQLLFKGTLWGDLTASGISAVDRANKIRAKISDLNDVHRAYRESTSGIVVTTGKLAKSVTKVATTSEGTEYKTDAGKVIKFGSDGRTYVDQGVTQAEIEQAKKEIEAEKQTKANKLERSYKEMRDKNNQGDRSGRH